jgi:nucleotide-binding universal stress UspA family protein
MSIKMAPPKSIDAPKYLANANMFADTAKAQASAHKEASAELASVSAKVDEVSKSSKPADERSKELEEATKTFKSAKNKIGTAEKTTRKSNTSLTDLETELRKELAKDPRNKTLVGDGGMVEYRHLVSGLAIKQADLTEEAKTALNDTVTVIKEARAACYQVEVASKKAEGTKKDPKGVEATITKVKVSIDEQKASEVRSATRAAAAVVQKEAAAVRTQAAQKAQAAKETAEKPFKDLKSALLEEIGQRKSKGSMEAIVKIAKENGLSEVDLKEVQLLQKKKRIKEAFLVK